MGHNAVAASTLPTQRTHFMVLEQWQDDGDNMLSLHGMEGLPEREVPHSILFVIVVRQANIEGAFRWYPLIVIYQCVVECSAPDFYQYQRPIAADQGRTITI